MVFYLCQNQTITSVQCCYSSHRSGSDAEVYHEPHDMCITNAHEDLDKIPYATFGIGYDAHLVKSPDSQLTAECPGFTPERDHGEYEDDGDWGDFAEI